ncbi:MAG: PorV/PorQ family protein [Candidatus Cloacimonetes bacterium]|nr:PorV/PorQ family protein [Candidatus Cloacimonadota bacterium]
MKSKVIILTLISIMLIPIAANAISEAAVMFLLIEPSARTGGMGQAYVAQTDDAFAGYWNTGAMAFNRKKQFGSMFSNWFGKIFSDMYYFHLAGNNYIEDLGNVGFAATYMTYGKQDQLDEDGNLLSTFESYDLSIAATYGYQTSQRTGVGLAFKFILSDLAPEGTGTSESGIKGRGMSYAFDLGLQHKGVDFGQILVSPYNGVLYLYNGIAYLGGFKKAELSGYSILVDKLDFGFNYQNIGPNITYINESQSDPLPMNLRMGFSYRVLESKYNKFCLNADMNKMLANGDPIYKRIFTAWTDDFKDGDFDSISDFNNSIEIKEIIWGVGGEYTYLNLLTLRSGYLLDRAGEIKGFSFGAGFHYTFNKTYLVNIDYAFQPGGELQDYNQTLSLKLEF